MSVFGAISGLYFQRTETSASGRATTTVAPRRTSLCTLQTSLETQSEAFSECANFRMRIGAGQRDSDADARLFPPSLAIALHRKRRKLPEDFTRSEGVLRTRYVA
jgi:hypothetical protein